MVLTTLAVFGAWAAAVSIFDIRRRRVPNWLVLTGVAGAVLQYVGLAPILSLTWSQSLVGAVIGFIVFLPLYAFRAMGAADVKVFAVLGLWLGAGALLPVWMVASLGAGLHAIYAVARTHLPPVAVFGRMAVLGSTSDQPVRGAPYAAFLVIAAVGYVLYRLHPDLIAGLGG